MKKLFSLIGIFIGIYLIYVFLMYSNSLIFPTNVGNIYDCSLENNIYSEDLIKIAKKYDLTTFTNEYNNTSFSKNDVVFNYLNISKNDNIAMGHQDTVLPTDKILYRTVSDPKLMIQRFWIITNKNSDFKSFIDELSDYGIHNEIFESPKMNFSVIFSQKNINFFTCVMLLFIFCISIYYMLRSKEVAILKLNGYNHFSISTNVIKIASIRILFGYTLIEIPFCIYLALKHHKLLTDFFKLYLYIMVCIVLTMLLTMLVGVFFVKCLNIVSALKSNRNNKLLIVFIAIFKLCATIILIISAKNVYYDMVDLQIAKTGNNNINSKDFYYIKTSEIPDDNLMNLILTNINEINNDKVYNYSNPTNCLYGHESILDTYKKEFMYENPPFVRMSYNMLNIIPIYSDNGKRIKKSDFNDSSITILIPSNLSGKTEDIVSSFDEDGNVKVRYIKSGQEHYNFLNPTEKTYNTVYLLKSAEPNIYFNNGRVLFCKEIATDIEKYLSKNKIDSGTVSLVNLSSDYEINLSNLNLKLGDDLQFLIVNSLSFLLSVIAIGTVFCEFRKKEIAVFKILSIFPLRLILCLCLINILITFFVIVDICPIFSFISALEIIPYILIFYIYQSKKTIAVLKGE